MNAEPLSLRESISLIPREYNELVQRIPDWLQDHLRVLKGDLILEKVITRKGREESWETKPTLRSSVELRSAYEIDPAIIIGHFVIAGWGEREIDREKNRIAHKIATKETKPVIEPTSRVNQSQFDQFTQLFPIANAVSIASVLMMVFSRFQPGTMTALAVLLTIAAIVLAGRCFLSSTIRDDGKFDPIYSALGIATFVLGILAVQGALFGLLYGRWLLIGMSIVLGIVANFVWKLATSRRFG